MRTRLRQGTDVGRLVDWSCPVHLDDQTSLVIGLQWGATDGDGSSNADDEYKRQQSLPRLGSPRH